MRRSRSLLIALALVLVLGITVFAAGCSDDQSRANAAMDEANASIDKASAIDAELARMMSELAQVDASDAKAAEKALDMLDEAEAQLGRKQELTGDSIKKLGAIDKLDVSADYKAYVAQQIEIGLLQQQSDELGAKMISTLRGMYEAGAKGKLDQATLDRIGKELDAIFTRGESVDSKIAEASSRSESFFKDKGLE